MIGAIVMIFAAIWLYQSAIKAGTTNVVLWVGGCMAIYLASQVILIDANVFFLELFRSSEGGADYERSLASVGDRKNEGGFQGAGGILASLFMELMPPVVGFLIIAVIRLKFIVKEASTIGNLFSGIPTFFKETFNKMITSLKQGIKS